MCPRPTRAKSLGGCERRPGGGSCPGRLGDRTPGRAKVRKTPNPRRGRRWSRPRLQRAHAPTPTAARPPHTSPHRPWKSRRSRSVRHPRIGHVSAAWFPNTWGAGPEGPRVGGGAGSGRAGPRAGGSARVAAVRASAPRGPARPRDSRDWVLSVPCAFREGDSATRSRVEKLREIKNQGRELGRHQPLGAPRHASAQVSGRTSGPPTPTP